MLSVVGCQFLQVMEAVHVDSIPANLHAALSTAGSVLGVLCDAHHLNVLYITHAGSLMQVSYDHNVLV
jgi:hypothetical protein